MLTQVTSRLDPAFWTPVWLQEDFQKDIGGEAETSAYPGRHAGHSSTPFPIVAISFSCGMHEVIGSTQLGVFGDQQKHRHAVHLPGLSNGQLGTVLGCRGSMPPLHSHLPAVIEFNLLLTLLPCRFTGDMVGPDEA